MADSETGTHETAAKLRITRVKALSNQDVVALVTYLLARYPDTFPAMLDDAPAERAELLELLRPPVSAPNRRSSIPIRRSSGAVFPRTVAR